MELELTIFEDLTKIPVEKLVSDIKEFVFTEHFEGLLTRDTCFILISQNSVETFETQELCIQSVEKMIFNNTSCHLVASQAAYDEIESRKKFSLFYGRRVIKFLCNIGRLSIYCVCDDLDCEKPTFEVWRGTEFVASYSSLEDAEKFAKSLENALDEALEYVSPPKTPKPSGGII